MFFAGGVHVYQGMCLYKDIFGMYLKYKQSENKLKLSYMYLPFCGHFRSIDKFKGMWLVYQLVMSRSIKISVLYSIGRTLSIIDYMFQISQYYQNANKTIIDTPKKCVVLYQISRKKVR